MSNDDLQTNAYDTKSTNKRPCTECRSVLTALYFLLMVVLLGSCSQTGNTNANSTTSPTPKAANSQTASRSTAPTDGTPCYTLEGAIKPLDLRVVMHNTPWGEKTARIRYPSDEGRPTSSVENVGGTKQGTNYGYGPSGSVAFMQTTVYVNDGKDAGAVVSYSWFGGVDWVKVEGKEFPKCAGSWMPEWPDPEGYRDALYDGSSLQTPALLFPAQMETMIVKRTFAKRPDSAADSEMKTRVIVTIDHKGKVVRTSAPILEPLGNEVKDSVLEWKFKPKMIASKPVFYTGIVTVEFKP